MNTTHPTLATRFDTRSARVDRSHEPLSEDRMRAAAPSIFAEGKHVSRSDRYTYIPTIEVLRGLRRGGASPSWSRKAPVASRARRTSPST